MVGEVSEIGSNIFEISEQPVVDSMSDSSSRVQSYHHLHVAGSRWIAQTKQDNVQKGCVLSWSGRPEVHLITPAGYI